MNSWPRKIYLLFWIALIVLTGLAALIVPKVLDQSQEQGYHEIEGQGKPPITRPLSGDIATRFPVRPILEDSALATVEPGRPERQAFPITDAPSPKADLSGLPQRDVTLPAGSEERPPDQVVTTRAWVARDSSVFVNPNTTASVLGTVASGTQVRWVRQVEPGWEEILLKDGRRVYMLTSSLRFKDDDQASLPQTERPDVSLLPPTVDDLLSTLRDGDLLRAETYLAPNAPPFEGQSGDQWSRFIGADTRGRVGRMEPVDGLEGESRSVLITDESDSENYAGLQTVWRWNGRQKRWLLSGW